LPCIIQKPSHRTPLTAWSLWPLYHIVCRNLPFTDQRDRQKLFPITLLIFSGTRNMLALDQICC
jgi:hypothetical protein